MDKNQNEEYKACFLALMIFINIIVGFWLVRNQSIEITDSFMCVLLMSIIPIILLYHFPPYLKYLFVADFYLIISFFILVVIITDLRHEISSPWPISETISWLAKSPVFRKRFFGLLLVFLSFLSGGLAFRYVTIKIKANTANGKKP
jgi:hypothetical protein